MISREEIVEAVRELQKSLLAQAMPLLPVEVVRELEPIRPDWYR